MKESIRRLIIIGLWGLPFWSRCVVVEPDTPAWYMQKTFPTTNLWYEADDSVRTANEESGVFFVMSPDELISMTGRGLLDKPYQWLTKDDKVAKEHVPKMLEALSRSGPDCQITNILHQALLAPTNYYRDATFHAYVMASPVPMAVLAETVVKRFPAEQRRAWYNDSRRLSFKPAIDAQYIDRPSREALRFAHFLFTVKQIESDPECLRAIGNPVDPKWECQQERKDEK